MNKIGLLKHYVFIILFIMLFIMLWRSGENKELVIIGTTDVHARIDDMYCFSEQNNEFTCDSDETSGFAKLYTAINFLRQSHENTLLFDNGDTIQGTILSEKVYKDRLDVINPIIDIMNFMQYDAMTIGNHEFDHPEGTLINMKRDANFPLLAGNVYQNEELFFDPYTIIEIDGLKVGVIGFTHHWVKGYADYTWDPEATKKTNNQFVFTRIGEKLSYYIKLLKHENVDLIVGVIHDGLVYRENEDEVYENSFEYILKNSPGLDLLLLGHNHITVNKRQKYLFHSDTVIGAAKARGNGLVKFTVNYKKILGKWLLINKEAKVIPVSKLEPSQKLLNYVEEYLEELDLYLDQREQINRNKIDTIN